MARKYIPPKQRGLGQLIDSLFILALVYVSLYIPLWLKSEPAGGTDATAGAARTWDALGVAPAVREQWERLGYDAEKAAVLIDSRFDYTIDPLMLAITAAVIVGYFVYLLKVSDRQYREVIAERFGDEDAADERAGAAGERL